MREGGLNLCDKVQKLARRSPYGQGEKEGGEVMNGRTGGMGNWQKCSNMVG